MVQKASRLPTAADRLRQNQVKINELYALDRIRTIPRSTSPPSTSAGAVGGEVPSSGNFLPTSGGTMIGPIAFDPQPTAVSGGRINIGPLEGNPPDYTSNILVTGQGTPDDIEFIDGAAFDGQLLIYQGTNQQIQNIINATLLAITNIVGTGINNIGNCQKSGVDYVLYLLISSLVYE